MKDMRYYSTEVVYDDIFELQKKLWNVLRGNMGCDNAKLMDLYDACREAMKIYDDYLEQNEEN